MKIQKIILFLAVVLFSKESLGAPQRVGFREIEIRTDFGMSREALTTEMVGELDPRQPNPHLQRWVLQRQMELVGLTGFQKPDKKWGVRLKGVDSINKGYMRAAGLSYLMMRDFQCEKTSNPWFQTYEGVRVAIENANELWIKLLKENEYKLNWLLNHVGTDSVELALKRGQQIFNVWNDELDLKWRTGVDHEIRAVEWAFYLKQADAQGYCKTKKTSLDLPKMPFFRFFMEPVSDEPPLSIIKLLARAPARLWNGLFSVRIEIDVDGRKLNGRFLIDSSASVSLISPSWLESQGIYPAWAQIPNVSQKEVIWNRLWNQKKQLAKRVFVNSVTMSGFTLPIHECGLVETEIFNPPESLGTCCDGLIANDFLTQFPVEFQSDSPAEVRVWPKKDFHRSPETPWVQVSSNLNGELVSQCEVSSSENSTKLQGVRWDTGSQDALSIHIPWQKKFTRGKGFVWSLVCDRDLEIAKDVPMFFPNATYEMRDETRSFAAKYPAVNIGAPLLNRGTYTLDLPHGRLWLNQSTIQKPIKKAHLSSLELQFVFQKGERVLQVRALPKDFSTKKLIQAGLKKGMIITQIDHQPADEMDQWEVDRHLSGEFGDHVSLEWETKKGRELAPLRQGATF